MAVVAIRLLFAVDDGGAVALAGQQRLQKLLPPGDGADPGDRQGCWVEVRDASGAVLDRRAVRDPLIAEREVFSPEPGASPRWVAVDQPPSAFMVLIADIPEADHVVLVANGTRGAARRFASEGPHEIAKFPLTVGSGEAG